MNTEISKINVTHKFVLIFQQRLDLKGSNEYVALQHFSICYTGKNIS